ncbi:unnamed protein product [Malus baccata var. baccata]
MGVHVDERINIGGRGIYTFHAQGALYHKIGGILPHEGNRPRSLQAYIYDTEHEVENRMCESEVLDRCVVEKIQQMLNNHNPFVHTLRSLGQSQDLPNCKLILKEQPIDHLAAIIIDGDDATIANGRDIVVETISGRLSHYPLLLPHGTYGWDVNSRDDGGRAITCYDYYAYMLHIRHNGSSLLLRGGRLLQQYTVDNYIKIESQKLRWLRSNQATVRVDLYKRLEDSLNAGHHNAGSIGRRIILTSSFVGSPRDMYQRYQDAMTLVQRFGKPDLFITMTCNPSWEEIKSELLAGQTPQDRPDLLTRVFCAKLEQLKEDIIEKGVLGSVVAYAYVIEFQKRGLPHVHMLVVLDENDKINNPYEYDRIVRAEILNEDVEPQLYNVVLKHMIHGLYKRKYSKPFALVTVQGNDSYPIYQRRGNRLPVSLDRQGNIMVDNSWVIPYNPWLLLRYDCHINVEICASIKSVKYLYKYVYKGPDRVTVEVQSNPEYDEMKQFRDARWVCAPEALWKIFKFIINQIYPSIERLQIHLPNMHQVQFRADESIINILHDESTRKTMLTEFFTLNHVIGQIYAVSPVEGEKFYLRILLNHVRGPTSFTNLRTINGVLHPTFKQTAEQRGLLERDDNIRQCLLEASTIQMPSALRRLFVTILVYCAPIGVRGLWDEFYPFMIEDYVSMTNITPTLTTNGLLRKLNILLVQFNKSINEFDLPQMTRGNESSLGMTRCIEDEISIGIPQQDLDAIERLNDDQRKNATFFVDGPGETRKTYLYCALLASLRRLGHIILATGRTTHSKFKIPLSLDASSMCSIGKQSDLAKLIQKAKAIIWDEATIRIVMHLKHSIEFLPVIRKGTKSELIQASVVKASFWSQVKILKLKQNMRSINDREFSKILLRVGDENEDVIMDDMVKLPECMVIPWEKDHMNDATYMVERAVVTSTNEDVDLLNEKIITMFPGLEETMYSFDSLEFLNSISLCGLSPHKLTLKKGAPIMLLRNIDPKLGLCNVFLPRISLKSTDTVGLPFELTRKQFSVKISFSITTNKSQGQTIPHVGVYFPDHVFSHGQLYVALSMGVSKSTTTVLVKNGSIVGQQGVFTRNVVYKEVLLHSS